MTFQEKAKFIILRSIGNFLVLFSLYGVVATFGPAVSYEVQFRIAQARGVTFKVETEQQLVTSESYPNVALATKKKGATFGEILAGPKEQILIPKDTLFDILIPKIGANAKVFSNVDPAREEEFLPILQQGVAHAKGSVFPGMNGNTYLFAHSTDNWWNVGRYNAVFYLLKELSKGDEITVFFENKRYDYVVTDSLITDPTDVSFLTNSRGNEQKLILQTCWPPGTSWKRLFIVAKPKTA